MYEIQLTDSSGTKTLPELEVPLTVTPIEIATDIQVLSGGIYTDFINSLRSWTHTYRYLTKEQYDEIMAYYNRQFTDYIYPRLTIVGENVSNVPVRMTVTPKQIIDNCGTVTDFTVSFREAR